MGYKEEKRKIKRQKCIRKNNKPNKKMGYKKINNKTKKQRGIKKK
jgi:hypothetical protein